MARHHLAQEPEGEELEADDDEQDAEREQRALADRMPGRLEHGQVDEDHGPDRAQEESQAAEEMERPVAVTAHEGHGQEVEEAAQVTLEPVPRAAVLSRAVVDRELGDAG